MSMMSSPSLPARHRTAARPEVCAHLLGKHIRIARTSDGRPVEKLAPSAGMTVEEWESIEAGQAPDTWEYICMMIWVLNIGPQWRRYLAQLYEGACSG